MKVTYTGKTKDFTPQLEKKVEAKLAKLGKLIEQRGEKEAHVAIGRKGICTRWISRPRFTITPCLAWARIRTSLPRSVMP